MRKIPATIATQHPDNASAPYWSKDDDPFVNTYQETEECLTCLEDLGMEEYMWDWEGKNADASVVDKLLTKYYPYFSEHRLGKDKFLTFRVPNIWEEKGYSLLQAMTIILSSEDFARDLDFKQRPLFEVILPMTVSADQLIHMHKLFNKFSKFKSAEFTADRKANTENLEVIPLVEGAKNQREISSLLIDYIKKHQKLLGKKPDYIRVFIACSDPALTEGFITTKLSNKLALVEIEKASKKTGVKMYPFAGAGSLPFRGGITPETTKQFAEEFAGLRTITLQSAFRYDYPVDQVKSAVAYLNKNLEKGKTAPLSGSDQRTLNAIAENSSKLYKQTIKQVAPGMEDIFEAVPKRRERRQHIGLLAYKRSSGGLELPRAITFTCGFYSIGVPPEFIASGRTLAKLSEKELDLVKSFSPNLISDFTRAGRFLNKDVLDKLASSNTGWDDIKQDIEKLSKILKIEFKPETTEQKEHIKLSSKIFNGRSSRLELQKLISQSAILRKSLG
ncbi:MAG TPA: phosphoenolpyruvate carboxylase [Candidatus Saccharimonadales bacterium]|nr:phosphoenolpyruvate carboxylase [Candidatus Saccharimonadales bacterium]